MKPRFPLYARILFWLFLNIAVLLAAALLVLGMRIKAGAEALVSTLARPRLQTIEEFVRGEIMERPRAEWDGMLSRFGQAQKWEMYLFRNDGGQIAGQRIDLPEEVLQRLKEPRLGGGRRGGRAEFRDPAPRPLLEDEFRPEGPGDMMGPESRDRLPLPGPAPRLPRFVVRTDHPRQYWIGIPVPGGEPGRRPAGPLTLLLRSDSLNAGGLVMNTSVWFWAGAGAILFSIILWLPLVRGITGTIAEMKGATARIAEGKFDARLNESRGDELGDLSVSINQMASRLDGFVTGQKRFLGDIAHELCSPIARMQVALGILEERADSKNQSYVADVKEEVQHMSALVNELLSFSKASLAARQIALQPTDVRAVAEKAIAREGEGAEIRNEVPLGLMALADSDLLLRALANLIRNATRYAGSSGPIAVSAASSSSGISITVADSGPGVPETELPKLFDPFYRVDTSRARETGGVGLGLAIVRTCVESCRGTVACRNRPGGGFAVTITLSGV